MKRLLSVLLAVIMIFSCCTLAVNALYLETATEKKFVDNLREKESDTVYTDKTYGAFGDLSGLIGDAFIEKISEVEVSVGTKTDAFVEMDMFGRPIYDEYNQIVTKDYQYNETVTKQYEILGVPISYIYNNTGTFFWKNLTAHPTALQDEITKSDISLLFGNVNMFLLRVLKSLYSDFRFYTDANAVACINFIGKLFYTNFTEYAKGSVIFSDRDYIYTSNGISYADEEVFFQKVAELSGFSDLIQTNWVDYGNARANYRPLLLLLGVTEDTLLESEYFRGDKIAPAILLSAFTKIMGEGPLAYFLNILKTLSKTYRIYYYDAISLLFTQKKSYIDDEDLKTLTGLLNLIFNDNDATDENKFQFAPLPEARLALVEDDSEFYLTVLMYMNLNAHYRNNQTVISNFKVTINNSAIPEKSKLIKVIDGICGDNIETIFYDNTITNLTMENFSNKPGEVLGSIKEAITRMIKKIADWFQMWIDIFTGELEFGAGAFE